MRRTSTLFLLILLVLPTLMHPPSAFAQTANESAVVRAVLFFSPTCPHCHVVMNDVLPPIQEQFGDQLVILEVDASQGTGRRIYQNYLSAFNVPDNRVGVPALIVEDVVLVGSQEIPDQFPSLIAAGLRQGGTDWPEVPGLEDVMTLEAESTASTLSGASSGMTLAWIVLIGMFIALAATVWLLTKIDWQALSMPLSIPTWLIPLLAVVGLGVSGYMAYVEVTQVEAVCGPVGDCNAVQGSSYAQIFGIPVALLGMLFYLSVAVLWLLLPRLAEEGRQRLVAGILMGISILGTLFSIYLTALEIFTIQAVCAWCLTSAIISTGIMLLIAFSLASSSRATRQRSRARRRQAAH